MKEIIRGYYKGERPLFHEHDLKIVDTIFDEGESPLKESRDIELYGSMFKWKYPLWYSNNIKADNCTWFEMGRSGVWYTNHISVKNSLIEAPKNFRRCTDVTLENVSMPNAAETFWSCDGVVLNSVTAKGDYFGMNSSNVKADNLTLPSTAERTSKCARLSCSQRTRSGTVKTSRFTTRSLLANTSDGTQRTSRL